ncbi:hypothetical protein VPH35_047887 [Triticum aestivum]
MLMQTLVVREFDLAADNWEHGFLPHVMAGLIVGRCLRDIDQHGSVARAVHCDLDMSIDVSVMAVYNEPRALFLACEEAERPVAQCAQAVECCCCCICMEDFASVVVAADTMSLTCSHAFHARCLVPWFYKPATCPMCRHDLSGYLTAATHTPGGAF